MKQEDKKLLIKALCGYLLYGVKVCYKISDNDDPIIETLSGHMLDYLNENHIVEVKPYLRPIDSMTEEEKEYIKNRWCSEDWYDIYDFLNHYQIDAGDTYNFIDWLNENKFDYRGLIPMGLALLATEEMYKTK